MLTVPRSRQPDTRTQSISSHSGIDGALLLRRQQIWMINRAHSPPSSRTRADLWRSTPLASFAPFCLPCSTRPTLSPEMKPAVQGLSIRTAHWGQSNLCLSNKLYKLGVLELFSLYWHAGAVGGGDGGISVKGVSEGDELRTTNKKHLARQWTTGLFCSLINSVLKVKEFGDLFLFFNLYHSNLHLTTLNLKREIRALSLTFCLPIKLQDQPRWGDRKEKLWLRFEFPH